MFMFNIDLEVPSFQYYRHLDEILKTILKSK